ncbi:MAG: DNA-binding transcriptional LysR family regulator [Paracoccaceae bacterium]|jgi:DNA-binding transcriptional LysR family regulator
MAVAPPRPKSLPLGALRAFEAAARLGGFAAAAEELGVSPGAVSAHIKAIEAELGAPLFKRTARQVELTPLGAQVQPEFTSAFDALGSAVHSLRAGAGSRIVHIAALPAIAQFWLSPRLPQLRSRAPEISISITAMEVPPNLKRTPYDLCLFYGGDLGVSLGDDVIFPVCAPDLAARLHSPADLAQMTCLTDSSWESDWAIWAKSVMPGQHFAPQGPIYSLYALAVEETINGAGVLMGHESLIGAQLAAGSLVAPFYQRVRLPRALRMWSLRRLPASSPAGRVSQWLQQSFGSSEAALNDS